MVFNTASRLLKCSYGFKLGNTDIEPVRKYCYLGIQFSLNGSFKQAIDELRKKAVRAYFSIKRIVDTSALTTSSMIKLIESLVKPVATYACQVWLPSTNISKRMATQDTRSSLPSSAPKDPLETTHLKMLKWVLGVHKKTNNNFTYGDTGRMPWGIAVLPQCIRYFLRAEATINDPSSVNLLLHHTFQEQKNLQLTWYTTWKSILQNGTLANPQLSPAAEVSKHYHSSFIAQWKNDLTLQRKMSFYRCVKREFGEEKYLSLNSRVLRSNVAKMRSSSHDMNIERGRYTSNLLNASLKACRFCCNADNLSTLEELPFFIEPITESEEHALTECPGYHQIRSRLSDNLKSLLLLKEYHLIMSSPHLAEFAKYLTDCHWIRNPKAVRPHTAN